MSIVSFAFFVFTAVSLLVYYICPLKIRWIVPLAASLILVYGMVLLLIVSVFQQKGSLRKRVAAQNLPYRWAIYMGLLFAVIIFGQYGPGYDPADFIYGNF